MLIDLQADTSVMLGFVLITLLVLAGPLAYFAGVDSRSDESARRRLRS